MNTRFRLILLILFLSSQTMAQQHTFESVRHQRDETRIGSRSRYFDEDGARPKLQIPLELQDEWDSIFHDGPEYDSIIDNGYIFAFASDGDNLYIGGAFEFFNGVHTYNIIHYNKKSKLWTPMGNGFNGSVYALGIKDGKLYAGGNFTSDPTNSNNVLRYFAIWNGLSWQEVGGGLNGNVNSIIIQGSKLVIGGGFDQAGNTPVTYIASWDGQQWDDMGLALNDYVYTLLPVGDSLFVGGSFYSNALGLRGVGLYYNNHWSGLGEGLAGAVQALSFFQNKLWVGGDFFWSSDLTKTFGCIATWDGAQWNNFGDFPNFGVKSGNITKFYAFNNALYIGGNFAQIGTMPVHSMMKWDGNNFISIGAGIFGTVEAFHEFDGLLYVGGSFLQAGPDKVEHLATIGADGSWKHLPIKRGASGGYRQTQVTAVAATDRTIYIAGLFSRVNSLAVNHIAAYDRITHQWSALGRGVDEIIDAIAINDSKVYVGGGFENVGDSIASNIAYWDIATETWHPMGSGCDRIISAIAFDKSDVIVSRGFVSDGSRVNNFLSRWNGNSWNQIDAPINGYINAIGVQNGIIYIGGSIGRVDGIAVNNIAAHDVNGWHQLENGVSDRVRSFAFASGKLYVAGDFVTASGITVNGIAEWNGLGWNDLDGGMDNVVVSITSDGSNIYAGGWFTEAGGNEAKHLAKWNGEHWSEIAGGIAGSAYGIAFSDGKLLVGGNFTNVNNNSFQSYRFGVVSIGSSDVPAAAEKPNDQVVLNNPNPCASTTTFHYSTERASYIRLELYDVLGRKIKTIYDGFQEAGEHTVSSNISDLRSGSYKCALYCEGKLITGMVDIVK